jgi:hypothetical protein
VKKRNGSAKPEPGRCGARLRGKSAGRFCTDERVKDRTRCRAHGGATPREAAQNATKHGAFSKREPLTITSSAFDDTEKALIREWRRDPEEGMKQTLAEVLVVQRRMLRAGFIELYARLSTTAGTISRSIASLHQVPPADRTLPGIEFVYGDKREDFADDMTRQPAEAS